MHVMVKNAIVNCCKIRLQLINGCNFQFLDLLTCTHSVIVYIIQIIYNFSFINITSFDWLRFSFYVMLNLFDPSDA